MDITHKLLKQIEKKIGDSWYILDTKRFTDNYIEFLSNFRSIFESTEIAYSYKTNYIPQICKIVNDNGGFAEVVSEMEYDLSIKVGVKPEKIIVNGPYKPKIALEKFLINGSIVNLDSYVEFEVLKEIAIKNEDKILNVGLRCNFDFSGIQFSRFGLDIEDKNFFTLIAELRNIKNVRLRILHCHFPNRDLHLFGERVDKMISLYKKIGYKDQPIWIDIGGGLGGKLNGSLKAQLNQNIAEYKDYAHIIATKFQNEFKNSAIKPKLILEPGTALVADTMKYVCKVLDIKNIRNNNIAISTGSKINFQPMSSKINMPINVYGDEEGKRQYFKSIDISGYTCMEGDYLFKNYCGELKIGDFLVFSNVGSYSIVFKPPFILPNVPILSIYNNKIKILKKAETFDSIFQTYNFEY